MQYDRKAAALELGRIRNEPGFLALELLLKQMKDELFERWTNSDTLTKDFCRGAIEILDTLIPTVDALIEAAREEQQNEHEVLAVTRGTGDLAL